MTEEIKRVLADNMRFSDDELLTKLADTEHQYIERKPIGSAKGWLKTMVAFANSCPVGYPGFLFIGVDDKGNVQRHTRPPNFEEIQKEVSRVISHAFPPIYHYSQTVRKNGLELIVATVLGSEKRPHFSGKAYIRVGPETKEASDEMVDVLVAERSSKIRALRKMIGTTVIWYDTGSITRHNVCVTDCDQFVLFAEGQNFKRCFPLDSITISYEPESKMSILQIGR